MFLLQNNYFKTIYLQKYKLKFSLSYLNLVVQQFFTYKTYQQTRDKRIFGLKFLFMLYILISKIANSEPDVFVTLRFVLKYM